MTGFIKWLGNSWYGFDIGPISFHATPSVWILIVGITGAIIVEVLK